MGVRPDAQVSHVIWNVGPGVQDSGGDDDNVSLMDLTASATPRLAGGSRADNVSTG